jgi:hypothetical protein
MNLLVDVGREQNHAFDPELHQGVMMEGGALPAKMEVSEWGIRAKGYAQLV